jgi:hypothetical protein
MLDSRSCKNFLSSPQYSRARSAELWPRHVCQNSIMTWANHRSSVLVFLLFTFGLSSIFYFLIIRSGHVGGGGGSYAAGLMWCPGVAALYFIQVQVSRVWLQRFRFGPFEWLWRSLTYGNRQPMRR